MSTKSKALPKGIAAGEFDKAVKELRAILGDQNVLVDEVRLTPYKKIMMPVPDEQHAPSAAITPQSVEQIQSVLKVLNKHKIPVYPISTGKNLGYGSAAPVQRGCTTWYGKSSTTPSTKR